LTWEGVFLPGLTKKLGILLSSHLTVINRIWRAGRILAVWFGGLALRAKGMVILLAGIRDM
jgi:hypothetical protein